MTKLAFPSSSSLSSSESEEFCSLLTLSPVSASIFSPLLSMIQELSGMARGTIISCNKELTEQGYIAKQQYVRREGDFGYNRVYISHLLRRRSETKRAETFRVIVNSGVLSFESKCAAERSLSQEPTPEFAKAMRYLFRNTRVAHFIRTILRSTKNAAVFLCQKWGSRKKNTRFINLKPVLII